jgi:hypothetical protein
MTTKDKFEVLGKTLENCIEAESSNIYGSMVNSLLVLKSLGVSNTMSFTVDELIDVLIPLSRKWDKEIDKLIG